MDKFAYVFKAENTAQISVTMKNDNFFFFCDLWFMDFKPETCPFVILAMFTFLYQLLFFLMTAQRV